jgi:hypothetical protein
MSDQSDLGIVLANAPRLERAFGRKTRGGHNLGQPIFRKATVRRNRLTCIVSFSCGAGSANWLRFRG